LALALPNAEAAKARARVATAEFTKDGEPNLRSSGVLVFDPTTGQTLFSKNADQAAPIASITKLMTAMVVIDAKLPMDEAIEITSDDIDLVKNTKSRLPFGSHFRRDDLLRLALMASDNRAASALGRTYPGGIGAFVAAMNAKAAQLGTTQTHYVDSSGLSPNNVSTPADLGKIVGAATSYSLITEYTTTGAVSVTLPDSKRKLNFVNTNALVRHSDWKLHQRGRQVPRDAGDHRQHADRDRPPRLLGQAHTHRGCQSHPQVARAQPRQAHHGHGPAPGLIRRTASPKGEGAGSLEPAHSSKRSDTTDLTSESRTRAPQRGHRIYNRRLALAKMTVE
jgi:D-alanyl-D-alanine endopeptidase (penicillin-binding protein 7)